MNYRVFFSNLGFDFKNDFKSEKHSIAENFELFTYSYKNFNQTNTSFYLITTNLLDEQLEKVRRYIWNKNNADIIFLYRNDELQMLYAKCSPQKTIAECEIDTFSTTEKDDKKLENIKRWQFDSGSFWLNYTTFLHKAKKYNKIDKDLIETLVELKNQLNNNLKYLLSEEKERSEKVQALIDRTLYIKYLEDNHIINSFFYKHYFNDDSLNYKEMLTTGNEHNINRLFEIIHKIFNNKLFDNPKIEPKYLTTETCSLIAISFSADLKKNQLRLFDFQFDVLPIEFISYIYEVFLTEEQKTNGIYYTPKKLAQLIVDDVISEEKIGSVLDPSCGSGMFLIVGFQRLLEIAQKLKLEPSNNIEKIKYRTKLLSENIFGIEKQPVAQRLTLFSLSLQVFDGIPSLEIKQFIAQELEKHNEINLFSEYDFYENILCQNTLDIKNLPFKDKKFDYIVGNPPFFKIKETNEEISFLNNYRIEEKTLAKDIVGSHQISQCFLLKIKDWAKESTRFGFVSNSSSFYNDNSAKFQKHFYANYGIEKIYELSRVKKILFEKANESVVTIIFNNQCDNNIVEYYPVEMGLFSEKPFELLLIQEDKVVPIKQEYLQNQNLKLRDYLIGNEFDFNLLVKLKNNKKLLDFILYEENKPFIYEGLKIVGEKAICKEYKLTKDNWKNLKRNEQVNYYQKFKNENTAAQKNSEFKFIMLKPNNINNFIYSGKTVFLRNNISNFERARSPKIYSGDKIIFNRTGSKIKSIYSNEKIYFDFDLHVFRLNDDTLYHLINSILNSKLINYFIDFFLRKRMFGSFSKIGNDDIFNIPVPKELDEDLVNQISEISKDLTDGKYEYSEKEAELNELIFDLYDLSYIERQRVRDYFLNKKEISNNSPVVKNYKSVLAKSLNFYLKNPIKIDDIKIFNSGFRLFVAKIPLNGSSDTLPTKKVPISILNEIFEQNPQAKILSGQEKIFGKDCVYIIKEGINKNWTETKAFEDRDEIIKHLI